MGAVEITVIVICAAVVVSVFGIRIYKKIHHIPVDECAYCQANMKRIIKQMRKQRKKEEKLKAKQTKGKSSL
jgi:hypothetical protein